ncbi:hypothetical protein NP233_g5348 [Leucocoprinus birnbaumii]|uniref:F-box domain-containing protein n=1 Tax=Leucocoprinus birnbaumii TaxID=56174 RepID=A0AAD5VT06_9AGAR|nr:hypothetical protein NP233_g5348 [Leucocoprinus birnbaumii]
MGVLTGSCPQCGYPTSDDAQKACEFPEVPDISPFTPSNAQLHSPNDDHSRLLCQEISRIDDAIHQLYEERASVCRQLNQTQSLGASLPSNVLINIFHYVCPPTEYNTSHERVRRLHGAKPLVLPIFALSAVSSRWRQILFSAPSFWAKLDWHWKYHLSPDDTSSLLRTYFIRAAPLNFDLKLTVDEKWEIENTIPFSDPDHIDGHLDALKQTIFYENADRIGKLSLDAPIRWLHLLFSGSFIHLSDLFLRSGRIDETIDLSHLPALTKVTFMNIKVTPILQWKRITQIRLFYAHINVALELLKRCTHLTSFHSHHPHPVKNGSITQIIDKPFTHHHLKRLEWSCLASLWDDALFRFISFPNLRKLSLNGNVSWDVDCEQTLTGFLLRLPVSDPGVSLELGYIRDCSGDPLPVLKTIFRALGSSLRSLTVSEDNHIFLEKLIGLLIPSYASSNTATAANTPSSSSPSSPFSSSPPSPISPSTLPSVLKNLTKSKTKPTSFTTTPTTTTTLPSTYFLPSLFTLTLRSPSDTEAISSTANTLDHGTGVFTRLRGAPQQLPVIIYGDLFVELLKQRRKVLRVSRFCLDLDLGADVGKEKGGMSAEWRERCKEEVRRLVDEGFELEVREGGRRVEWL